MSAFLDTNSTAVRRIATTRGLLTAAVGGLCLLSGCGERRPLAPVTGLVLYNGKPLESGTVFFQPEYGQPATAIIQPDGTFALQTTGEGIGAVVGRNRVRVACYEAQPVTDEQGEGTLGRLLIPRKYTDYQTSGLTVEVVSGQNEPIRIELTGQAGGP
ncbi:MAG: hypothetical protein RBS80_29320 [Thermoguttaceae bacterium]|nr:hypothetical protein [Thermoguttaceae bacterium]